MSTLIAGTADDDQQNSEARKAKGEFVRPKSNLRHALGTADFPAEPGRYHLYVGFNCPWCHRLVLARAILGLEDAISMDVAFPTRSSVPDAEGRDGLWVFKPDGMEVPSGGHVSFPECTADTVNGFQTVVEMYDLEGVDQRSVPILYDKKQKRIVNNESAEILRMLSAHAEALGAAPPRVDLYPAAARAAIDELNKWIYNDINNGSYKAGFVTKQAIYEEAYHTYFAALDRLEGLLATSKFVAGDAVTEADLRLFPTIFRHDAVYYTRFKLCQATINADYPNIFRWMRTMYADVPGVRATSDASYLQHCKQAERCVLSFSFSFLTSLVSPPAGLLREEQHEHGARRPAGLPGVLLGLSPSEKVARPAE